jgi:uncharacterized membrane protein
MESALHAAVAGTLTSACELAGALFGWLGIGVLAWGGLRALFGVGLGALRRESYARTRLDLGTHLALSLEFLVAKDVLDSIVAPTWDGLSKLAAIVALRTAIQFSLSRELRELAIEER